MIPQPDVATTNGRLMKLDTAIGGGFVLLGGRHRPGDAAERERRAGHVSFQRDSGCVHRGNLLLEWP